MKSKNNFLMKLVLITVFFNVWFPKAGIKIAGLPLTIGNILLGISFLFWILSLKKKNKTEFGKISFFIIIGMIYFILKYLVIYFTSESISILDFLNRYSTFIIPLIIYPIMYFIVKDVCNDKEKIDEVMKVIYWGFIFICVYALLQYMVGIDKVDIPGLTVNYSDYVEMGEKWYLQKSNGSVEENSKIVSTYQNGNLFGINLIILFPIIYFYLKENKKQKIILPLLLLFTIVEFLTLSRTCWLGIILFYLFGILFENDKTKQSIIRKTIIIFGGIITVIFIFKSMPSVVNRFFNTSASDWISMSGRTEGLLTVIKTVSNSNSIFAWIIGPEGIIDYSGLAYEMLPTSLFSQVGIIGMLSFYIIFIYVIFCLDKKSSLSNGLKLSLIIWLIIANIECGYWLPPTPVNIFTYIALINNEQRISQKGER